jgi:hypothetical protein
MARTPHSAALWVIETLDVIEHVSPGFVARAIGFALGSLCLQRREEALYRRIVLHIARPPHAADHTMIGQQPLELLAGVAALVGMMQQGVWSAAPPERHDQGIGDELRRHARAHRPTHDATGEQVSDHRHIEPTFRRPDIREISDPSAIWSGGLEAAVKNIGATAAGSSPTRARRLGGRDRQAYSKANE